MTNEEYFKNRDGAYSAFNTFCRLNGKPEAQDCAGCPVYGISLGANTCFHGWLRLQAEGERQEEAAPVGRARAPWTYQDAKAALGKVIEYNHPNHSKAAYLVIGAYQAQNGRVTVLMAGDALSVEMLAGNAHYTMEGRPCARKPVADYRKEWTDEGPLTIKTIKDWQ